MNFTLQADHQSIFGYSLECILSPHMVSAQPKYMNVWWHFLDTIMRPLMFGMSPTWISPLLDAQVTLSLYSPNVRATLTLTKASP